MAVCLFIIFALIIALGITYYFGFVKNDEETKTSSTNIVQNEANSQEKIKENIVSNASNTNMVENENNLQEEIKENTITNATTRNNNTISNITKDTKLENDERNIKIAFKNYIQKLQDDKEMDELIDINNITINILSEEQTQKIISTDSLSYKQGDIMATINYSVRPQDINNTKWLASDGIINGDFIEKTSNVVLRDGELIIIGTSW